VLTAPAPSAQETADVLVRAGGGIEIAVADTGIGLKPDKEAKLFREFVRIKNENTVEVLGSGLGLSTVRKIATMCDGETRVTSEPGIGSTFTVTLKVEAQAFAAELAAGAAATGSAPL
jgi:signal transduction histidine kinase